MQIEINGDARTLAAQTLADVWRDEALELGAETPQGFAIALNGRVVPKARWPQTPVAEGDRIEIIRAMAGG